MRDLQLYADKCMKMLDALRIRYAKNITFSANTRAVRRLGVCKKTGDRYIIEIASSLLDENIPEAELYDTLLHELLHTCYGCMKHTGRWKALAAKVNAAYGTDIKRAADPDSDIIAKKPKYRVVCPSCGAVYERYKRSALIQHPERYRCGKCKSKLEARG